MEKSSNVVIKITLFFCLVLVISLALGTPVPKINYVGATPTPTPTPTPVPSPTLKVIKHVINDNGGGLAASNFTLHVKIGGSDISGSPATGLESPGRTYSNLSAGTYVVSEDGPPAGYLKSFSGSCNASGSVTLAAGQTKTCTVNNNDIQPSLTVFKVVVNHGLLYDVSHFPLSVADYPSFNTVTPVNSGASNGFNAGTYSILEQSDPNYTPTFSGDPGCPTIVNGTITLAVGDVKICTITNTEKPTYLTVNKTVINHGNTKVALDFAPYKVDANTVPLDTSTLVDSGTHTVTETVQPGYTRSFPNFNDDLTVNACNANGSVTLNSNDNKTCTIRNEDGNFPYITEYQNPVGTDYVPGIPGAGLVTFKWRYNHASGTPESSFIIQVADGAGWNFFNDNPPFVVDRTFDNLNNPDGTYNQQSVMVYLNSVSGALLYNHDYYARFRVQASDGAWSQWAYSGVYRKTGHPGPYPEFTFSPSNPAVNATVTFTNTTSHCYDNSGEVPCTSFAWDFGDGTTSTMQNPPTDSYTTPGTKSVMLKAYDSPSNFNSITKIITVGGSNSSLPSWKETSPY